MRFSKKGEFKVKKGESMSKTGQKQRKLQKNREIFKGTHFGATIVVPKKGLEYDWFNHTVFTD